MGAPSLLFRESLKSWFGGRGFLLVVAAALVPLLLTGSWVLTHKADIAATDVTWDQTQPVVGKMVNFTATVTNKGSSSVGAFNITVVAGGNETNSRGQVVFSDHASNVTKVSGLGPGASATARLSWTPSPGRTGLADAEFGTWTIVVIADSEDDLPEVEEANNLLQRKFQVQLGDVWQQYVPTVTPGAGPSGSAPKVDLVVEDVRFQPDELHPGRTVTIAATVRNAGPSDATGVKVTWGVVNLSSPSGETAFSDEKTIDVPAGGSVAVQSDWMAVGPAVFLADVRVDAGTAFNDTSSSNNRLVQPFFTDREQGFKDPPERYTIKRFYTAILSVLYLRILLPLIALFYAAGVIADEREKGNLVYLLTRPVPRPLVPAVKFAAGFLVSAVAVVVGVVATYLLLLGTPTRDLGYLTTPLLVSLLALLVYGAFFVLVGVHVRRPYLLGLGFIAWETSVLIASTELLVNDRPLAAPWMQHLTVSRHLITALQGWSMDAGLAWLPAAGKALEALWIALAIAVGAIAFAVWSIKRREFDE